MRLKGSTQKNIQQFRIKLTNTKARFVYPEKDCLGYFLKRCINKISALPFPNRWNCQQLSASSKMSNPIESDMRIYWMFSDGKII